LGEGFAVAAHGAEQDDEVLDGTSEDDADQDPECTWQITKLRGEDGADERAGAGNGGEVMAENDPFVCADEVAAVIVDFARGGAAVIEDEDAGGDPFGVEAVAYGVGAEGRKKNISRTDVLTPMQRQGGISIRAQAADQNPKQRRNEFGHAEILSIPAKMPK